MGFSQTYFATQATPWYQFVGSGGMICQNIQVK
jgi:hypothetical protein